MSGNKLNIETKINFTTFDIVPPIISVKIEVLNYPGEWDLKSGKATNIQLTLDAKIDNLDDGSFYITPVDAIGTGDKISASLTYVNDDKLRPKLTVSQELVVGKKYYVVLNAIRDKAGNIMQGNTITYKGSPVAFSEENYIRYIEVHQTGDNIRPIVQSVNPTIANDPSSFKVTFDEEVFVSEALPTSFRVGDSSDSYSLMDSDYTENSRSEYTININERIRCNVPIRIRVTNVEDLSLNKLNGTTPVVATDEDVYYEYEKCYNRSCVTTWDIYGNKITGSDLGLPSDAVINLNALTGVISYSYNTYTAGTDDGMGNVTPAYYTPTSGSLAGVLQNSTTAPRYDIAGNGYIEKDGYIYKINDGVVTGLGLGTVTSAGAINMDDGVVIDSIVATLVNGIYVLPHADGGIYKTNIASTFFTDSLVVATCP